MLLVGVLLALLGIGALLAGIFGIDVSSTGQVEVLGIDAAAQSLFVLGVAATLAIWWGYRIGKFGAQRQLKQRREQHRDQKQYDELSQKLGRAEKERDRDLDEDRDRRS